MTTLRLVVPKAPEGNSASLARGTKVYLDGKFVSGVTDIKLNCSSGVWEATITLAVVIEGMEEEPVASVEEAMAELLSKRDPSAALAQYVNGQRIRRPEQPIN